MEYPSFSVQSGLTGERFECRFRNLKTGITPRHSDTVDVQFLVNGVPVVVALSLAAFAEYRTLTGETLTDPEVMHIAAICLEDVLEKEGLSEDRVVVPTHARTMELAEKIHSLAKS
jgi:hypothetical protein